MTCFPPILKTLHVGESELQEEARWKDVYTLQEGKRELGVRVASTAPSFHMFTYYLTHGKCRVHDHAGDPRGKNNKVPHINNSSTVKLSTASLHFTEVITMLVVKPNQQYHHYLDTPDDGPSPVSNTTEYEIFLFMALTIQFYKPFHSNMIKRDRFIHILCFL
jgi:hypothetical protein